MRMLALLAAGLFAAALTAADYKSAKFVEGLPQSKDGKPAANARFEYEVTDRKTKKTETKTVDVLLSVGYTTKGWLDEKGKAIPVEKIIDFNKPGLVADISTEKKRDGIEYVTALRVVTAPEKDEKKKDK